MRSIDEAVNRNAMRTQTLKVHMNSKWVSRRKLLCVSLLLLAGVAAICLIYLSVEPKPYQMPPKLPAGEEILKATAKINDLEKEMGILPVPEFTIPHDAVPTLLHAIGPVELARKSEGWEKMKAVPQLGDITFQTKLGGVITITIYDVGKTRAGFTVNGISCIRGGDYGPVFVSTQYKTYEDESFLLSEVVREIYKEKTDQKGEDLPRLLERLERSRGEKPPERE